MNQWETRAEALLEEEESKWQSADTCQGDEGDNKTVIKYLKNKTKQEDKKKPSK